MPAFTACDGNLFDITDGLPGVQINGYKRLQWGEECDVGDYQDNTTGCNIAATVGGVTREGDLSVNLQDGVTKGQLPFRARQTRKLAQHIDGSGDNFWELDCLFISVSDHEYDMASVDPVEATFGFRLQSEPIGHGTLAATSS